MAKDQNDDKCYLIASAILVEEITNIYKQFVNANQDLSTDIYLKAAEKTIEILNENALFVLDVIDEEDVNEVRNAIKVVGEKKKEERSKMYN